MSSIYKKGRDGYYYYQTYVYNPESKKKNKRIFHALGTKDLHEAEKKQSELDIKYDRNSSDLNIDNRSSKYFFKLFVGITALILIIYNLPIKNTGKINKNINDDPINKSLLNTKNISEKKQEDIVNITSVELVDYAKKEASKNDTPSVILKQDLSKAILPAFTIEKIIRSSDVFKQGRVHVTVSEKTNDNSLRLLCDSLANRFDEFSNIVICLYADNHLGKEHAMGNYEAINAEEQKRIWLAMYTYNSVEGVYFDNNPSDYLGTY